MGVILNERGRDQIQEWLIENFKNGQEIYAGERRDDSLLSGAIEEWVREAEDLSWGEEPIIELPSSNSVSGTTLTLEIDRDGFDHEEYFEVEISYQNEHLKNNRACEVFSEKEEALDYAVDSFHEAHVDIDDIYISVWKGEERIDSLDFEGLTNLSLTLAHLARRLAELDHKIMLEQTGPCPDDQKLSDLWRQEKDTEEQGREIIFQGWFFASSTEIDRDGFGYEN